MKNLIILCLALFAFQSAVASESPTQNKRQVTETISSGEQDLAATETSVTDLNIVEVCAFLISKGLDPQFDEADNSVIFDYGPISVKLGVGGEQVYMYTILGGISESKPFKGKPITDKEEVAIHRVCAQKTKTCSCVKFVYERESDAILVTFESLIPDMEVFKRYFATCLGHLLDVSVELYSAIADQMDTSEN